MTSKTCDMLLNKGSEWLAEGLTQAWTYLDLIYYAGTNERVRLMFVARDCCRMVGTVAVKKSLPPGSWPLGNELMHGVEEVRRGVQALDDLMHDTRIDLLMRGRATRARNLMNMAATRAQACLDQAAVLALAADAITQEEA